MFVINIVGCNSLMKNDEFNPVGLGGGGHGPGPSVLVPTPSASPLHIKY